MVPCSSREGGGREAGVRTLKRGSAFDLGLKLTHLGLSFLTFKIGGIVVLSLQHCDED